MALFPDAESFRPFVEAHFGSLASFARSVLGNDLEAEDAAQEAFLILYARRERLADGRDPRPYLYRIALRRALARLRRDRRRAALDRLLAPLSRTESAPPADPLDSWFASLPRGQRVVAHLHFAEELTAAEIAARLGLSPSTVRVQLSRVRRRLQSMSARGARRRFSDVC